MQKFKIHDQVFPRWSQYLPAFKVQHVGPIMVTVIDDHGNREHMHGKDLVLMDPAVNYPSQYPGHA